MLTLLLALALAQQPADPPADATSERTVAAERAAEPTPEPVPEPIPEPQVEIGPIAFNARHEVELPPLTLERCPAAISPGSRTGRAAIPDGQLLLQLTVRKGKLALVSVASADKGMEPLTPCLERELAAVEWPLRRGKAEVPVTVSRDEESNE